jgi:5'-nucleotidase
MPHILITNDDGVHAPGLLALAQALRSVAHVSILAPHRNWSVSGHNKTMNKPLRVWSVTLADDSDALTTDGGPSDCVVLATRGLLAEQVDLVISGINNRPNLGNDITYSGTVAAAMEATIAGFPALAISAEEGEPRHWDAAAQVAARIATKVLQNGGLPRETLLNINVPNLPESGLKGWQITRLGQRRYHDELLVRQDSDGRPYYWIGGEAPTSILEPGTDVQALAHGYVSITPLHLDMTHHQVLDAMGASLLAAAPVS